MKKIFSWFCGIFLVVALAGCGQAQRSTNQIEVWHWMADRQDVLEALAKIYEEQAGIKVKIELFAPPDAYTQKVLAAAQANVLPEIYGILDEKKAIVASFIKAGFVSDLTAEFQADEGAWQKTIFPKALDVNRFIVGNKEHVVPGIYGVPLDVGSEQLLYNRRLLKRVGITKAPETFAQWLAVMEALRRVGITPFVSGFGELWLIDCFASNYAFNIMGEEKVLDTFRGQVAYTDPDWIKVFTIFETLAQRDVFIEGIVTKGNKLAEQDFALERVAFAFNGAWAVNVYKNMNAGLDYGLAPLPRMNPAVPMVSWGGAESSLVVNAALANKDKAIAFLKWLTAREQQVYMARELNVLPANREAMADIAGPLVDFARALEHSTHPRIWPVGEDPVVRETRLKGIQAIMIGEATPLKVAQETQALHERQLAKRPK